MALGSGGRIDEAVIFRFGCRRDAEGGWLGTSGGDVELGSEGERAERVWLFTDEVLLRCVETDGRRCQGGGGFSGSPDSCRWRVLTVSLGEGEPRVGLVPAWLLARLGDRLGDFEYECGDRDRCSASSYGFSRSSVGDGD